MTDNDTDAIRRTPLAAEPGNNTFVVWYDPNNEPYAVYFRSDTNAWDDDQRWFNADQAGGDLDGPYSWDNLREELRGNDGPHLLVPAAKVDELTAERDAEHADAENLREALRDNDNCYDGLLKDVGRLLAERDATNAALAQSREQAATYANEIGTLTAENARVRQQRDGLLADLTDAGNEVDLLTAENTRLRPVVEAARAWRQMRRDWPTTPSQDSEALIAAVDALPAAEATR